MNDHAGDSGGGSTTPTPNIEFEVVDIEVDSVSTFGEALVKDAENLKTASKSIKAQLKDPSAERGEAMQPLGADPRQIFAHQLGVLNSQRMTEANIFLESIAIGVENLGKVSKRIAAELGDGDALNAANLNDVQGIINDVKPDKSKGA